MKEILCELCGKVVGTAASPISGFVCEKHNADDIAKLDKKPKSFDKRMKAIEKVVERSPALKSLYDTAISEE